MNNIVLIAGLIIDSIAVLILILSAVFGIKKGGAKAGWKLFWRVLSIAVSTVITVIIGRIISSALTLSTVGIAKRSLPEKIVPFLSGNNTITGVLLSLVLPLVFLVVLLIISLIFLIPKILVWNKAIAPAYKKYHQTKPENTVVSGILGAILNCAAAMLLFFAIIMPLACPVVRGNAVLKAAGNAGLTDMRLPDLSNPVYTACDAVMGEAVYKPLISFSTAFGNTNIFSEAQYSLNIYNNLKKTDNYEISVRKANNNFRKSKLLPDIMSDIILAFSDGDSDITEALGTNSEIITEVLDSAGNTYKGVKKSEMRGDADALFSVITRLQASGFLSAKNQKDRDTALKILLSEDSVKEICNDLYESDRAVEITEGVANSFYNQYMSKMVDGTDVSFTQNPFDLTNLSKKEAAGEITDIISSLNNLNNFSETINAYNHEKDKGNNPSIGSIDMESLGKALDTMKNSSVLGKCYGDLLNAAEKALPSITGSSSEINIQNLIESAKNADSYQSFLGSFQGIAGLGETLSDKTLNESVREQRLTEGVNTLIENIDSGTAQQIGEDIASVLNVDNNPKAVDFISEYTKQIAREKENNKTHPSEQTNLDADKDARAIEAIYELLEHSNEASFDVPNDELSGYVQKIADSNMITQTMKTFAEQGETLGLAEALSEKNKLVISESIESANVPEKNKQAAIDFLKLYDF